MPRKKKNFIKKASFQVEVETSDDQDEKPKRFTRQRIKTQEKYQVNKPLSTPLKPSPKNKKEISNEIYFETAYDADSSESDQHPDLCSNAEEDSNCMDDNDDNNNNVDYDVDYDTRDTNVAQNTKQSYNPFIIIGKENITPPGSHSTPTAVQRAVRNLEGSFFGFEDLEEAPLTLTSLKRSLQDEPTSPASSTISSNINNSPSKRKQPTQGFNEVDILIENPKKRSRRKPKKEIALPEDPYEEIRKQFNEVEMHELVVEHE